MLRRKGADPDTTGSGVSGFSGATPGGAEVLVEEDPLPEPALTTSWSRGHDLLARALTAVLVAAILCGPVALGWQLLQSGDEPVVTEQGGFDQRMVSRRDVASEIAVQFVGAWLASSVGQEGELARYWSGQVSLPRKAPAVTSVRVVDAVASAPGVWSVQVAATVTGDDEEQRRRFFQVPIRVDGDAGEVSAAPMALPAAVAGPVVLGSPGSGSYPAPVSLSGSLGGTVSAFLQAYLTGSEDPERYVTPGSFLAVPAGSAAWTDVLVTAVHASGQVPGVSDSAVPGDGTQVHVLATVQLADDSEQTGGLSASYPLQLTARGGRWEITRIDLALHESASADTAEAPTDSPGGAGPSGQ